MRVVAFVLVGAMALVGFVGTIGTMAAGLFDLTLPFQTTTNDRSQPALLKSIQEQNQFQAAVGNFEVVVDVENDVAFVPDFIAGERSLFVAAGTVDAYVDFAGLTEGDLTVSEDGTSVEITLPEATLGEPNLDEDRTYLYSQERGVLDRAGDALSPPDQSALYILSEQKLAAAAAESELTDQAEENTRAFLTGFFEVLDLSVTFTD